MLLLSFSNCGAQGMKISNTSLIVAILLAKAVQLLNNAWIGSLEKSGNVPFSNENDMEWKKYVCVIVQGANWTRIS